MNHDIARDQDPLLRQENQSVAGSIAPSEILDLHFSIPKINVDFVLKGASCLNMVERFFRDLTHNRLRCGVFRDLEELIMASAPKSTAAAERHCTGGVVGLQSVPG